MNRIGLIIGQLTWGGAERQLFELASRLSTQGFEPWVYCLSEAEEPYGPLLSGLGISVRQFPRRSHFDLSRVQALRRTLKQDKISLSHAWLLNDDAYTALAHLGHPRPWIASMRSRPLDRDGLRKVVDRWTFRRADWVVANQREVVSYLEKRLACPPSKVSVIHNGINLDRLRQVRSAADIRREVGTPEEAFVITCAGRLEEVKNIPLLLQAFRHVLDSGLNAWLWIVGDGSLRGPLEGEAESLGFFNRVCFTGVRRDFPDLLHASDLLVLCSHSEGLPNVVLEAMGCGTPALVSPHAGCGDVICQGNNGWIAPDQTPQAYQAIIQTAAEDPERLRVIGGNAARTIRESYSIDRMVVQFAELYRRLLGLQPVHSAS